MALQWPSTTSNWPKFSWCLFHFFLHFLVLWRMHLKIKLIGPVVHCWWSSIVDLAVPIWPRVKYLSKTLTYRYAHTCMHACMHTYTCTRTHACRRKHARHACVRMQRHTCKTHMYTHTYLYRQMYQVYNILLHLWPHKFVHLHLW